jgi:hypothetical protein
LRRKTGGVKFTVRHPWRTAADRRPHEEGPVGFIAVRKAVGEGFLAHQGNQVGVWVVEWPKYGAKGAAATCGVYAGARLVGRRGADTAALRPMGARHVAPRELAGMAVPRRMDRQVVGCLAVQTRGVGRDERARRGMTRHDVVQGGALAQSHSKYPTSN